MSVEYPYATLRTCSYSGCTGRHCWCGAALTAPGRLHGGGRDGRAAGGDCRGFPGHAQDRPVVGRVAGRYDHDVPEAG